MIFNISEYISIEKCLNTFKKAPFRRLIKNLLFLIRIIRKKLNKTTIAVITREHFSKILTITITKLLVETKVLRTACG